MTRDFTIPIRRALCSYVGARLLEIFRPQPGRKGRFVTKYPLIGIVALEQGVTRQHLYEVLEGNRISPRLKAAYELKRKEAA